MGRRRQQPPPGTLPAVNARIAAVLDDRWSGNAKQMAADLGLNYFALLRVLGGANPAAELLTAVVARGGVDAAWLLTGDGTTPADFGIRGDVELLPATPALITDRPARDAIGPDAPRLPVITRTGLVDAYLHQLLPNAPILRDPETPAPDACLLLIEQLDPEHRGGPPPGGAWVVFKPLGSPRPLLGRVGPGGRIRAAGEASPRYRIGPDGSFDRPTARAATGRPVRYDAPVGGVTAVFRDLVAGRVLAVLRWSAGFLVTQPVEPGDPPGPARRPRAE